MDEDQKRLEDKVDNVLDKIGAIDVTLGKQQVSLDDHIRRTELLEQRMDPVEKNMNMIHGALKLIGLLSVIAVMIEAAIKIFHG